MTPALTTFLFQAANFLLLAGVLAWLFFKPVRKAIDDRRAALRQQSEESESRLAEARALKLEVEQRFAALEEELEKLRVQSRAAAETQAEQIVAAARETARQESEAARQRLSHLDQSQQQQLAVLIARTTGSAVNHLLTQLDEPGLNHALAAAACREIAAFDGNSLAPVRIESATPLDEPDRQALLTVLGAAAESAEFHVIEGLGTGLRVATNRGLIDMTSSGLATFAERLLAQKLDSEHAESSQESAHV